MGKAVGLFPILLSVIRQRSTFPFPYVHHQPDNRKVGQLLTLEKRTHASTSPSWNEIKSFQIKTDTWHSPAFEFQQFGFLDRKVSPENDGCVFREIFFLLSWNLGSWTSWGSICCWRIVTFVIYQNIEFPKTRFRLDKRKEGQEDEEEESRRCCLHESANRKLVDYKINEFLKFLW